MRLLVCLLAAVALLPPSLGADEPRTASERYLLTYPYYQIPYDILGALPSGLTCGYNIGGACFEVNEGEGRAHIVVDDDLAAVAGARVYAISSDGVPRLVGDLCTEATLTLPADTVRIEAYVPTTFCLLLVGPSTTGTITVEFSSGET